MSHGAMRSLDGRLYRAALSLCPAGFRREHGDEMLRDFDEARGEAAADGDRALWILRLLMAVDLARTFGIQWVRIGVPRHWPGVRPRHARARRGARHPRPPREVRAVPDAGQPGRCRGPRPSAPRGHVRHADCDDNRHQSLGQPAETARSAVTRPCSRRAG